jgi:ATP-dependent Clp protease ATP-binding subunit ClpA
VTSEPGDLREFGADARRAVAQGEVEARQLGHDRVGTEHLLLGLLANDATGAARMLADSGMTLGAVRSKVSEAVGVSAVGIAPASPLPRTPRATRALGRSARFCHARHAGAVTSEHLLWGVLDVEGTAGQVLRGLGVDIEQLRASLEALDLPTEPEPMTSSADEPDRVALPLATCPFCSAALEGQLAFRPITAFGASGERREAVAFSCGVCDRVLGVGPA